MKILFVGDIVGRPGREAVASLLPSLVEEHAADFVIANGENAANGVGITSKIAMKLLASGIDVITTGNHIWRQREVYPFLSADDRMLRPANYPSASPGRGLTVRTAADGTEVAVLNLIGTVFLEAGISPFRIVDDLVEEAGTLAETIVVDFHAEATSEKVAMLRYLDGRVTAIVGTHTHVPTADAQVTEKGTAYITDVGMSGPYGSVIGVRSEIIVQKFLTEMPIQFEVADDDVRVAGVVISCEAGRATTIERVEMRA